LHLLGGGTAMLSGFSCGHRSDRPINAAFVAAAIDGDWLCPGLGGLMHMVQEYAQTI
jgi:hypothetical protein